MKCRDIREQLWEFCREELPAETARKIETHLSECRACAQEYEAERKLHCAVSRVAEEELDPCPDSWADLCARIERSRAPVFVPRWVGYAIPAAIAAACAFLLFLSPPPKENYYAYVPDHPLGVAGNYKPSSKGQETSNMTVETGVQPVKTTDTTGSPEKPGPSEDQKTYVKPSIKRNSSRQPNRKKMTPKSSRPKSAPRSDTRVQMAANTSAEKSETQKALQKKEDPVRIDSVNYVLPQIRPQPAETGPARQLVIRQVDSYSALQASYAY